MEYNHSLHVEIQTLKDALTASEKKLDRYARLIATLSIELDDLRNNICHSCKEKLTFSNASVPSITVSASQGSAGATTSMSLPLSGRHQRSGESCPTTDNVPPIGLSFSPVAPPNTNKPLSVPSEREVERNHIPSQTTPTPAHPGPNIISAEPKLKPPNWSVVYHPEVKRAFNLHLAHAFTHDSPVYCVKISPDGQRLAVGLAGDGKTHIFELQTGSNICVFVDRYVKDLLSIWSLQFSPDGQLLATGASDGQIRIWDINKMRMRAMFKGHKNVVNSVAFSPNGRSLISGSDDRSIRIWNIRDGASKVLQVSRTYFISVAFSPDGWYAAAADLNGSLWIWDSRTYKLVANWEGHVTGVWCTGFSPDGKGLMSGSTDKTVKYWDVSSLGIRQGASTGTAANEKQGFPELRSFLGHDDRVRSAAFFPDNSQWIVTGSNDQSVRIWDTQSGVCLLMLQGHMGWVRGVDVSQTENFLAAATKDGHVSVWKYKLM